MHLPSSQTMPLPQRPLLVDFLLLPDVEAELDEPQPPALAPHCESTEQIDFRLLDIWNVAAKGGAAMRSVLDAIRS